MIYKEFSSSGVPALSPIVQIGDVITEAKWASKNVEGVVRCSPVRRNALDIL